MFVGIRLAVRDVLDIGRRARSWGEIRRTIFGSQAPFLLNEAIAGSKPTRSNPIAIAKELRKLQLRIKSEALDEQGRVDYRKLKESPLHHELRTVSRSLAGAEIANLNLDEHLAFWINLYNVLAIHGVLELDIDQSVMEIPTFFGRVSYVVGGHRYSLDDIENGVLRANAKHPASKKRLFRPDDPRLGGCVEVVDPRIHAALVCASASCPPVAFYEASLIDAQLDMAAANYVATQIRVDTKNRRLFLPITVYYYASDFEPLVEVLVQHADDDFGQEIRTAFDQGYKIVYDRYDWSLNHLA